MDNRSFLEKIGKEKTNVEKESLTKGWTRSVDHLYDYTVPWTTFTVDRETSYCSPELCIVEVYDPDAGSWIVEKWKLVDGAIVVFDGLGLPANTEINRIDRQAVYSVEERNTVKAGYRVRGIIKRIGNGETDLEDKWLFFPVSPDIIEGGWGNQQI